jgi:protein-disulfide isomerase
MLVWLVGACQTPSSTQARPPAIGPSSAVVDRAQVVARFDGDTITAGELDDSVRGGIIRADIEHGEKLHEVRSDGLDKMVNDRLLAKKAKAAGVTTEQVIQTEVYAKVAAPTAEEGKELYDQAVEAGKQLPPYDQVKDEIAQFIRDRKNETALKEYTDKLRADAKLELLLPPAALPKVAVEAVGPSKGAPGARVTIVEFSDYECPYCGKAEPVVAEVIKAYEGKVRLVYREYPLAMHAHAQKASEAALCALDQGKYWEMHEKMFDNQRALTVANLKDYASAVGLDSVRFDQCLDTGAKAKEVAASQKAGDEAGVSGTPAFFINGRPVFGAVPIEKLKEVIDAELSAGPKM